MVKARFKGTVSLIGISFYLSRQLLPWRPDPTMKTTTAPMGRIETLTFPSAPAPWSATTFNSGSTKSPYTTTTLHAKQGLALELKVDAEPQCHHRAMRHSPLPENSATTNTILSDYSWHKVKNEARRRHTALYPHHPFPSAARRYQKKIVKQVKTRRVAYPSTNTNTTENDHPCHTVCLDQPLQCLQKTTPNITLIYPDDAEAHFNEIRIIMAKWAQHDRHQFHMAAGYHGPWIENYWISHFESLYDTYVLANKQNDNHNSNNDRTNYPSCLSDIFGPYIPILLPFVDMWVKNGGKFEKDFVHALQSVLRPNVPYITVSQNDEGLAGRNRHLANLLHEEFPNLLVLSAGGYGHVPIPLLKQTEPPIENQNRIPVSQRNNLLSYVGSLVHAPYDMRLKMHHNLKRLAKNKKTLPRHRLQYPSNNHTLSNTTTETRQPFRLYQFYKGVDWRSIMAQSKFSLVPRGYGRTSYHFIETLQLGFIPIHVYTDVPWIPYLDFLQDRQLAYVVHYQEMEQFVMERLLLSNNNNNNNNNNMTNDNLEQKEAEIAALRESHFSPTGIMKQIEAFLQGRPTDLQCTSLPRTVRDASDNL